MLLTGPIAFFFLLSFHNSAVGIATCYTEGWEFESRWYQEFSLLRVVQTGPGAHSASYPVGTWGFFPGGKAAGA
jgi:hypothetical protein